jgi:hypothetical protein
MENTNVPVPHARNTGKTQKRYFPLIQAAGDLRHPLASPWKSLSLDFSDQVAGGVDQESYVIGVQKKVPRECSLADVNDSRWPSVEIQFLNRKEFLIIATCKIANVYAPTIDEGNFTRERPGTDVRCSFNVRAQSASLRQFLTEDKGAAQKTNSTKGQSFL